MIHTMPLFTEAVLLRMKAARPLMPFMEAVLLFLAVLRGGAAVYGGDAAYTEVMLTLPLGAATREESGRGDRESGRGEGENSSTYGGACAMRLRVVDSHAVQMAGPGTTVGTGWVRLVLTG